MTFNTKAGLTRVGFAKRTRNLKPRFSHTPNVVLPRSHVYTISKQWLGVPPDFLRTRLRASKREAGG
jgi:phosphoenolpyruvate carboxylase